MSLNKSRQESLPDANGRTFKIGDGGHHGYGGDSYPVTALYISDSGRMLYVSSDTYRTLDPGEAYKEGPRQCEFTTCSLPPEECAIYTLRGNGRFVRQGEAARSGNTLGHGRIYAQDPHF